MAAAEVDVLQLADRPWAEISAIRLTGTPAPLPPVGVAFSWEAANDTTTCTYVERATETRLGACASNESALLPPPGWLYAKFVLHTPRPRVGDDWDVGSQTSFVSSSSSPSAAGPSTLTELRLRSSRGARFALTCGFASPGL